MRIKLFRRRRQEVQSRPVDPQNLPRWVIYQPRVDRNRLPPKCACHGDVLRSGQRVLLWPVPNSGGQVELFHPGSIEIVDREEAR